MGVELLSLCALAGVLWVGFTYGGNASTHIANEIAERLRHSADALQQDTVRSRR